MRAVIQRVKRAKVSGKARFWVRSARDCVCWLAPPHADAEQQTSKIARKIAQLRILRTRRVKMIRPCASAPRNRMPRFC